MTDAIAYLTIGVADLQPVRDLWIDRFGLEVVAARQGPDAGLGRLLGIAEDQISEQLLLRTPGAKTGALHFVRFDRPDPPVRQGAAATDQGPKSIDVNCIGMPRRYEDCLAAGFKFRSAIAEYSIDDIRVREVQMPVHDDINVVLVEILSKGFEIDYSPQGYGAVTSFVSVVRDNRREADFFRQAFGLDELMHHRITGPEIEQMIGLPEGAAVDMKLMGREGNLFGRVELISYEALSGVDRFALAKAPALGTLHCGIAVESLENFSSRAATLDLKLIRHSGVDSICGAKDVIVVSSPAGLRIEVFEETDLKA